MLAPLPVHDMPSSVGMVMLSSTDLHQGVVSGLQVVDDALLAQGSLQVCVVWVGQGHTREQIADYAVEQWHIVAQEFAQVHIHYGPQHEHILIVIREPT